MLRTRFHLTSLTIQSWLSAILIVTLLAFLNACGGGGGGDSGTTLTDDPVPPMPSRVHYIAGGPGGVGCRRCDCEQCSGGPWLATPSIIT